MCSLFKAKLQDRFYLICFLGVSSTVAVHFTLCACFYHSDARNMARDVQSTLAQIVQECGHMSAEAAVDYVKKLQKRGRYLQDVWS